MKLTLSDFYKTVKTKSEASLIVNGLWIARSAIGIKVNEGIKPLFGFSAAFNREECETRSRFELLERLLFLPYVYDAVDLIKIVKSMNNNSHLNQEKTIIQQFLIGSYDSKKRPFNGNGCSISTYLDNAILHSKRELIERHICCEMWYKRSRPFIPLPEFELRFFDASVELKIYTTDMKYEGNFAIAALSFKENFFAIGASIRTSIQEACEHAAGEALMMFEDVIRNRSGNCFADKTRQKILSLRNRTKAQSRKAYFKNLLTEKSGKNTYILPKCQSIYFEPLPNIYAVRTFSNNALDPKDFEKCESIPTLPFF